VVGRFEDGSETGGRRPSSQPSGQSRDSLTSDLFSDAIFGSDDRNWLDMASGKNASLDHPRSNGDDKSKPSTAQTGNVFAFFTIQGAPPSPTKKLLPNYFSLNLIENQSIRLDCPLKFKCRRSAGILSVGI